MAIKWYGCGAQRHCDGWRSKLSSVQSANSDTLDPTVYTSMFEEELASLREVMFSFPEKPGAPPTLFRVSQEDLASGSADADAAPDSQDGCDLVADEATLACIAAIR